MKPNFKFIRKTARTTLTLGLALAAALGLYFFFVYHTIQTRMEQLKTSKGSQFYTAVPSFQIGQTFSRFELLELLNDQGVREVKSDGPLSPGEFQLKADGDSLALSLFLSEFKAAGFTSPPKQFSTRLDPIEKNRYQLASIQTESGDAQDKLELTPKKLGAFFAGRLRTQDFVPLSDIPVNLRHAVMAIEDVGFLEHSGVSIRGTVRALWRDVRAGRFVEGGSTITQQLMKNLFFSHHKSIFRKIKEVLYALVTEIFNDKETILEAYLNEVYLGQWSTHEIHGVSEGARYYFNRSVGDLSLGQSATLAALIQAPNVYDPRRHPERTLKRRNSVLGKMLKAEFVLPSEFETALKEKIKVIPVEQSLDDAAYFLDLVMKQLPGNVSSSLDVRSFTVYTTLHPYLQASAAQLLRRHLDRLVQTVPVIKKRAAEKKLPQGALVAIDLEHCNVLALQGGQSYRSTQFNRILEGKRQAGSLFKPFVFETGFEKGLGGAPLTPITPIEDTPFEWAYDAQVWKPKNYEEKYHDSVTARQALELSLNTATARFAQKIGIKPIVETLQKAGITSPLPEVPSISLGSADVTPFEVAIAYTTLARLGYHCDLRAYTKIFDENGNLIAEEGAPNDTAVLPEAPSFQTVDLMRGVFIRGTAKFAPQYGVSLEHFAGKTGTTNENKDAWFVGFSPQVLALVWVGYDEQEKLGLTGAAAAVPLWTEFIKASRPYLTDKDFRIPEGLLPLEIDPVTHALASARCPERQLEYFQPGTEPSATCPAH